AVAAVMRDGRLALFGIVRRETVEVFAGDEPAAEGALIPFDFAGDEGDILPLRLMPLELVAHQAGGLGRLADDQQARDAAVQSVAGIGLIVGPAARQVT